MGDESRCGSTSGSIQLGLLLGTLGCQARWIHSAKRRGWIRFSFSFFFESAFVYRNSCIVKWQDAVESESTW